MAKKAKFFRKVIKIKSWHLAATFLLAKEAAAD